MRKSFLTLACIGIFGSFSLTATAQTPAGSPPPALQGIKPNLAVGEVTAISTADNKISLQTTDGAIDVTLATTTIVKKVSAANPNLQQAADSSVAEISVGDKLLVTGKVAPDNKSVPAKAVYIMTKADIAKRDTAERDAWRTRGVSGKVTAIDFSKQQVTIAARGGMMGTTNVVMTPKPGTKYLRYASNSNKYSDAKDSSLAEIKIGDEVRAIGDKSEDGSTIQAEQVLSGSFKTVVGTITAIDTAKNEITIKETQGGKTVVVALTGSSVLKKFPAEMAGMMAGGMGGGMMRPGGQGGQSQAGGQGGNVMMRPPQQAGGQGQGQGGNRPGGGMRGGRDLDAILDRMPSISLADLKVGDAIGASSTEGTSADRYTAIKLVAGVEPFLAAAQAAGGGRGGRGGVSVDIPGLDGGFGEP
jgi:predicted RNA-binding protein